MFDKIRNRLIGMKKYPIGAEHYELYEEIGQGVSASVFRAKCLDNDEIVAIKVLDFERGNCDLHASMQLMMYRLIDDLCCLFVYLFPEQCIACLGILPVIMSAGELESERAEMGLVMSACTNH
ncbi:hypothetical protein M8C21_011193 [Ambrosia artemisiifolia]|uniref:Protein kinase domain-containing protein n=1 Tax=Ambrosia artemisiifolia TaxID=4212 RepID=A0AAD5BKK7_AMBAR|nr:hypothetical protein M8C21_011193 [Ambrosia artemisiifolia]